MSIENLSPEEMEQAFKALLKISRKAIEIVRRLDGKSSYIKLSEELGINKSIVSSVQRESFKLELATKNGKFYKKKPGILKYAPKIKNDKKEGNKNEKRLDRMKKQPIRKIEPTVNNISISLRINEAQKMANSYQWLYVTENALRDLIRKVLGDTKQWWSKKCPSDFMQEISEKMNNSPYNNSKRKDELEHCELDHLKKIISKNWVEFKDLFQVKDKGKFVHQFESALPTRNSIGHCIPLKGLDMEEVSVRFNDILKIIK